MSLSHSYNADRPDNKIPWFTSTVYTKSTNIRDHYLPTSAIRKITTRSFHLFFTSSYQMVYGDDRAGIQLTIRRHVHHKRRSLLALTEYVQQLVYVEQEKVEGVFVNGPNVRFELSNEFAHYAWHHTIYLIPHPLQLPSSNFTFVMLGIDNLVDTFNLTLSGSNQQKRSEKGSIDRISIASQDV
ncbi:hypothetical protein EDC96DRAFT_544149 [Choanephora cucurbitarum]|nr:hypothetical protein EDC96DRAFT_544149 [Choanephora cucurbitarum]